MDQIPPAQLYNTQHQTQHELPPFQTPIPRTVPNSHKPPTHPISNIPQSNNWREIASVSSKQLYPSPPPPPTPRKDTSNFVIVMYTTLTVSPEPSPKPQPEPARSPISNGFPTHRPDLQVTHVTSVGGDATITVSAAAPSSSAALARPPYAPNNFYSDPHQQDRTFNCYTDRQPTQFSQDMLPRPHEYPISTNPLQTHESHFQPHSLPPHSAPLDPRHTTYPTHPDYTHPIHPLHPQPDTTALSRQPRGAHPPIIFRNDASIPATPTTPATSATQPFSATPSSPDNNGASSNGSGTREHACTFPGCTKTFDRRYNLSVHYRRHTDEMPYPCKFPGCPQKFKWRSSQSHHMKTRHQMVGRGRTNKNNSYRRTGNTAGVNGLSTAGATIAPLALTENSMPQSHVPIIGLIADGENPGSYKRAFSPRKRTKTESHVA